jgi:hypothetical protein
MTCPLRSSGAGPSCIVSGKIRADVTEWALLSGVTSDETARELFAKLAAYLTGLADEVERAPGATRHSRALTS